MPRAAGLWRIRSAGDEKGPREGPSLRSACLRGGLGVTYRGEGGRGGEAEEQEERGRDAVEQALEVGERHDTHL